MTSRINLDNVLKIANALDGGPCSKYVALNAIYAETALPGWDKDKVTIFKNMVRMTTANMKTWDSIIDIHTATIKALEEIESNLNK